MPSQDSESKQVANYFETHAADFDSIYEEQDKGTVRQWRDKLSRGTVIQRLELAKAMAARDKPARVLDVGCGAGRFSIPLAALGSDVTGLDFAPEMVTMADAAAAEAGVGDKTTFLSTDYLTWDAKEKFDLTFACGVFDYVSDPKPLMQKMTKDTRGQLFLSFPKKVHVLVPLRKVRLTMEGCPVFFYTRADVQALADEFMADFTITSLGRDYMLIGSPSA